MNLTRIVFTLLVLICSLVQAQEKTADNEIEIRYDRFENVTTYITPNVDLEPSSPNVQSPSLKAIFRCGGNTGNRGCPASAIILQFDYLPEFALGQQAPFDYRNRAVIAIADGVRLPLGQLEVTSGGTQIKIVYGVVVISPATLRQLALATEVEMRVGIAELTPPKGNRVVLANLYNMAVLSTTPRATTKRNARRTLARQPKSNNAAIRVAKIDEIDYANFTYPFDGRQIKLGDDGETDSTVLSVDYGDLTKDGKDEAAVVVAFNFGGSSSFTRCFVYTLETGRPKLLGIIKGDESTHSGIADAEIDSERGTITIERYPRDDNAPHCCPALIETVEISWDGKRFIQVGTVSRKKLTAPN